MRRAFTLVELLVVISIMAVLAGILLPAIQGTRESARRARAISEMAQLDLAVVNAKDNMHARYVPSHAYIKPSYDLTPDNPNFAYNSEALDNLRQFFGPRFGTPTPNNPYIIQSGLPDWGDIYGSQCLVFFLGGYRDGNFNAGFSDGIRNPFVTTNPKQVPRAWFDFQQSRLWDSPNGGPPIYADVWSDNNRMMSYFYFTSRRGGDYVDASRQHNANGVCIYPSGTWTGWGGGSVLYATTVVSSPLIEPSGKHANQFGCQIISAGKNGAIGPGRTWQAGTIPYTKGMPGGDDLSNFRQGELGAID